jgi:hypothetical protein
MLRPGGRNLAIVSAAAVVGACAWYASDAPAGCSLPEIVSSRAVANPTNALSATLSGRVRGADSAAVRFRRTGDAMDSVTASVALSEHAGAVGADTLAGDTVTVPVLGLLPQTAYALELVAYNGCGHINGSTVSLTSGSLPTDLPSYTASGTDPTPGFVAFSAGSYGLVIDNTGRVVWYRRFPGSAGPGLNFQPQPTGRYVARPPTAPNEAGYWMEIDVLGSVRATFSCARGLQPRFHDLIALPDSTYWLMCDETRTMDLSSFGGKSSAQVTGTVIQHVRADGTLLFEWTAFDHFAITDLDSLDRLGTAVNWTHGNAIDLDRDGNLVASFRSLSEITKIDTRSGAVLWRMGGRAGGFAFPTATTPVFARQHGVRVTSTGALQLLDNLGDPRASRAKHVSFVPEGAASRAWPTDSFASQPPVVAQLGGSTQELPVGHLLVAYGNGNRVEEYDAGGKVVWRIEGNPGYVFRAHRIRSLYKPGVGYRR